MPANLMLVQTVFELLGALVVLIVMLAMSFDISYSEKERRRVYAMMSLIGLLLLSDALAGGFRGMPGGAQWAEAAEFLVFFLTLAVEGAFCELVMHSQAPDRRELLRPLFQVVQAFCAVGVVIRLLLLSDRYLTYYSRYAPNLAAGLWTVTNGVGLLCMVLQLAMIFLIWRELSFDRALVYSLHVALVLVSMVLEGLYRGISVLPAALLCFAIGIYFMYLKEHYQRAAAEAERLNRMQNQILISQIGPHFLYNCLSTIKYLIGTDVQASQDTVDEFAAYLRLNLDAIGRTECIPLEQELRHVQAYVRLEQRRFGEDRVRVEYDTPVTDCLLPALSLQPVVENAIKHGITKRLEGGTVTLSSRRTEAGVLLRVEDNGVGFAPGEDFGRDPLWKDGRSHIGVSNVRRRIEQMCGGSFTITSSPDKGTRVEILLPVSPSVTS